jgi:polyisoprenyl-phosphate glycosyltransferase
MTSQTRKCISIVTPCYNEELNVMDCYQVIKDLFATHFPQHDYEHIFCDNASQDRTPAMLANLAARDPRVKVILNAGNFGPFRSMFNGLMASSGDAVVVMVADLQDPPELIVDFIKKWELGYDIVYGIRQQREEGSLLRMVRHVYYRTVSRLASIHVPPDVSEFQLIDRKVVDALREFDDYYPYIRGMIAYCGFRSTGIPHVWRARKKGFSKNRLYHLVDQGLNGLISLSNLPMRACMLLGCTVAAMSMVYAVIAMAIAAFYFRQIAAPGIPTLIVALFFFSGVILFFLGVMGEYISAIHSQVRRRPSVVERARFNFTAATTLVPRANITSTAWVDGRMLHVDGPSGLPVPTSRVVTGADIHRTR